MSLAMLGATFINTCSKYAFPMMPDVVVLPCATKSETSALTAPAFASGVGGISKKSGSKLAVWEAP